MDHVLARSIRITAGLISGVAFFLILKKEYLWAAGVALGTLWSIVNFWLLSRILNIGILRRKPAQLPFFLTLKFPILYGIGFFILSMRIFPVGSLLVGVSSLFLMTAAFLLCPCIGISKMKFRYNHRGFGGLWAIPQGVTAEECDEEEHSGAPEGR